MIFSQEFKEETYDGFAKSDRIGRSKTGEEEYRELLKELFGDNLGENSYVAAPISGACVSTMKIGKEGHRHRIYRCCALSLEIHIFI